MYGDPGIISLIVGLLTGMVMVIPFLSSKLKERIKAIFHRKGNDKNEQGTR